MASSRMRAEAGRRDVGRGLLLMVSAVALLTVMDAIIKSVTQSSSVPEAMLWRCVFALPVLAGSLALDGGVVSLVRVRFRGQLLRAALAFVTGFCFFTALTALPMAEALVIGFASPFIVAALSRPLLGEPVSLRQWLAIGGGFLGVVVVLAPDAGLEKPGAVWALAAAVTYAFNAIVLRRLGSTDRATATAFWGTALPAIGYAALAIPTWQGLGMGHLPALMAAGVLGGVGSILLSAAYRLAPAATLAPLDYTALVWAVLLGWLLFGDLPGLPTALGAAMIVGSGILLASGARR